MPIKVLFFVTAVLSFILGCSRERMENTLDQEEIEFQSWGVLGGILLIDSSWLHSDNKFEGDSIIVWYPLQNTDYQLSGPCDSCHGASGSYFEFEHITWMRDSIQGLFPSSIAVEELTPGISHLPEGSRVDTLHNELNRMVSTGDFSPEKSVEIFPLHDFIRDQRELILDSLYFLLKSESKANLVLLPMQTQVILHPDDNEPQGQIEFFHHWVLWDLDLDKILIRYVQKDKWHSGNSRIDRETSKHIIQPLRKIILGVQDSIPEWAL